MHAIAYRFKHSCIKEVHRYYEEGAVLSIFGMASPT